MTFEDEEDGLDAFLESGFEPKAWMRDTDRVIDAYKGEVEKLRVEVAAMRRKINGLAEDITILKNLHVQLNGLLEAE